MSSQPSRSADKRSIRDEIKKYGTFVRKSEDTERRIEELKTLIVEEMNKKLKGDTSKEKMDDLLDKWKAISGAIRYTAIPYLRGGTDARAAQLDFHFENLNGLVYNIIEDGKVLIAEYDYVDSRITNQDKNIVLNPEEKQLQLQQRNARLSLSSDVFRKLLGFIYGIPFPLALGVIGLSWKTEDLVEREVIALQLPVQMINDNRGGHDGDIIEE